MRPPVYKGPCKHRVTDLARGCCSVCGLAVSFWETAAKPGRCVICLVNEVAPGQPECLGCLQDEPPSEWKCPKHDAARDEAGVCPVCVPPPAPAPAGRMSAEEFARIVRETGLWTHQDRALPALLTEARRARASEEIEARRANGAELLVDAKEAEIAALKAVHKVTSGVSDQNFDTALRVLARAEKAESDLAAALQREKRVGEAMKKAPHDRNCAVSAYFEDRPCNCWKSAALAGEERSP